MSVWESVSEFGLWASELVGSALWRKTEHRLVWVKRYYESKCELCNDSFLGSLQKQKTGWCQGFLYSFCALMEFHDHSEGLWTRETLVLIPALLLTAWWL